MALMLRLHRDQAVRRGEIDDLLVQRQHRPVLHHLLGQILHQVPRIDFGIAGHIEDVFLRVQRRKLPAELGQAVNHLRLHAAQSRIIGRVLPCRPAADNRHVEDFV